uniref:Transmembrane 9 superfamily member n=1 Tax=Mucochytrium quahogii TaxID=96639 RepID=A0A7S2RLN4_9STRA|mmetsp:Transcript_16439/g.35864  ORF Transcript_16439/g.35864 Transcript_16439/m.35864 type:complete len:651 (+) Transcript_16439:108-2060(+)
MKFSLLVGYAAVAQVANGFYLPGVAPREFEEGEEIPLKVNKLTSSRTQLPYDFYDLPFCQPDKIVDSTENLGEILTGNVIQNSLYKINMYEDVKCRLICKEKEKAYTKKDIDMFIEKVNELYIVNWIVDNLPGAYKTPDPNSEGGGSVAFYQHGFPLGGTIVDEKAKPVGKFINNHVRITLQYHVPDFEKEKEHDPDQKLPARIVGMLVEPFSIKHKIKNGQVTTCPKDSSQAAEVKYGQKLNYKEAKKIAWTYSVEWVASDVKWASRWDVYLSKKSKTSDEVHWFSIINSLLIVVFLTGMVAMIMMRTLHKDLSRYNRVPTDEEKAEEREETGWKLVHGDVFRPPPNAMLFAITIGTGVQVLGMAICTIIFAAVGFLSPANRGSLMIALLLLFMFMGIGGGYYSARTYKKFNGAQWQRCTLGTAFFYPSIVVACIFLLNLLIWAEGSSSAIPFTSMLAVLALWFCISVPLTFLGAFYGYKKDVEKAPVHTQDIPRAIPTQPWYMSPWLTVFVGGILPFGAVFVELFFILSSIWLDQYYVVFGFLLLVFVILVITCAEITIVLCYFQLCGEDYRWWWRAVFTSGSSAVYLFLYAVFYFSNRLKMNLLATAVLYFGYMFILSLLFFLATGCVGYFACLWFTTSIYRSLKVD